MKAVILAGGLGTRLSEETAKQPKPMVTIGGKPILWHIMKIYSHYGINEFIICLGYKGHVIKDYFLRSFYRNADFTIDLRTDKVEVHEARAEPWKVTLVDTGENTMTGGRLKRIEPYIGDDDIFCMTYGDGVGDVDIAKLIRFHRRENREATLTAMRPPGRFGELTLDGNRVASFKEKPTHMKTWVSGGFFVLSPRVFNRIKGDETVWEEEPLQSLVHDGQLSVYRHEGFLQPMDTLRERKYLEGLWASGAPPWKVWT